MSSSIASSSTSRSTFFGAFDRPATPVHDLEAQTTLSPISQPPLARTHIPHAQRASAADDTIADAIDAFFGVTSPRHTGTRDSRHDQRRRESASASSEVEHLPPSYEDALRVEPPAYTPVSDQPTLAMYLFKFGFLFPLFWVAGAFILLSPLHAPEDWEAAKPQAERQELIASMRRAEVKWATRCLCALFVFVAAATAVASTVVLVLRS